MQISAKPSDKRICHTREITNEIFKCLESPSRSKTCGYSFVIGNGYYCKHRDRSIFAASCPTLNEPISS